MWWMWLMVVGLWCGWVVWFFVSCCLRLVWSWCCRWFVGIVIELFFRLICLGFMCWGFVICCVLLVIWCGWVIRWMCGWWMSLSWWSFCSRWMFLIEVLILCRVFCWMGWLCCLLGVLLICNWGVGVVFSVGCSVSRWWEFVLFKFRWWWILKCLSVFSVSWLVFWICLCLLVCFCWS